jgi:4-hydroxybenzoyl-CoA thioesterase
MSERTWFTKPLRIPFSACDPAGIVFFVQYHVMFQNLTDEWFTDVLGISYAQLLGPRRVGLPTVRLESDFRAISVMGDEVVLALSVERLGEKSMTVHFEVRGADAQPRVETRQVMVCTNLETHRSTPFPPDVRAAIESFMQES